MNALMMRGEFLLMKRNLVVCKAKVLQVVFMALVSATLFLFTEARAFAKCNLPCSLLM